MRDWIRWSWRATAIGVLILAVGLATVLLASIQAMVQFPGTSLVDGYWTGLLPLMGIGTWLVPIGAILAVAAGIATVLSSRLPLLVRLGSLAGVAAVLFWAFIAVIDMTPRSRPGTATTSSDLATVVYSRPETTVVFLLIPMALIVALAFAGRRTER